MMPDNVVLLAAVGFGLGWLPWAPGTFGSLLGLPLAWWLAGQRLGRQTLIIALLFAVAVPLCYSASLWLESGDASRIVADEYLVFPIAVSGLARARCPWVMGMAFVLYRFFDISKLPPINHMELIGGGLGIVLDDVGAAIYTWVTLATMLAFWRWYKR
jgi:phosphatidylglycerophosphatase A